jgi:hypothetical protein
MTYLTLTKDEREGEYSEPTEYQIGLDEFLKAKYIYDITLNFYYQQLTDRTITKEVYEEKIGPAKKLLEDRQIAFESIKQKIPGSASNVTGKFLAENRGTGGGKKSKGKSKKVAKKPVVSQKKQSIYKEILGKQMKIYKMPDSRKEYVKYKGELLHISDYKDLIMKQKANAKPKAIAKAKPKK